jgi:hypothetical protein
MSGLVEMRNQQPALVIVRPIIPPPHRAERHPDEQPSDSGADIAAGAIAGEGARDAGYADSADHRASQTHDIMSSMFLTP